MPQPNGMDPMRATVLATCLCVLMANTAWVVERSQSWTARRGFVAWPGTMSNWRRRSCGMAVMGKRLGVPAWLPQER
jgi:hypothetical protein